ncbi:MAG: deoxyribose-phosphate aldolase [Treponema sp.]|jgi:deoxyribose-phosphate aldolase|nr:deoxyribose-phosphate aldolase [Treponema sp.]
MIGRITMKVSDQIAKVSGVPPISPAELSRYIDHTLLKADAGAPDIDRLCEEAKQYHFFSVCVNGANVIQCAGNLQGSDVKVCSVAGFPLGAMAVKAKAYEAALAIEDGAREIDMVMNIGAMKAGNFKLVEEDMAAIRKVCSSGVLLKVIIETCLLTTEEIIRSCEIAKTCGLDFVKTSTGFSTAGAAPEHIALMRKTVGPVMGVKAAGGVRSFQDAVNMINAGATRLGTSGGINIIRGQTVKGY